MTPQITPESIKQLRGKTGAGMMLCKQALTETSGNFEEAIDWLRKKGCAAAQKRSGRETAEGLAALVVDGHNAVVVEVNCETDFVARNEKFQHFVNVLRDLALGFDSVEDLKKAKYPGTDRSVEEELLIVSATAGETLNLRRLESFKVHQGFIGSYVHNTLMHDGGKIACLVVLESDLPAEILEPFAKQLAMHVAAAKPEFLRIEDIDEPLLQREREIFKEQAKATGKPDNVLEKVVDGKMQKYYQDYVLLEQVFVMDNKTKIKDLVHQFETEHKSKVVLKDFARCEVGEGL